METIKVAGNDGAFIQYIFMQCPDCSKIATSRGTSNVSRDETEFKKENIQVRCKGCGFHGVLVGSAIIGVVEFDMSDFRKLSASA